MNQLTSGPNPRPDFGYDFDYAVWTAGTRIDLVNVPFNNDYRDVVKFANKTELKQYIDSLAPSGITIEQMTYVRPNVPIRVNIPFNRAVRYNYLRASNPTQPIDGDDIQKDFYYFILDAEYVAPNTTKLTLQLDVWQTYVYDVTFGRSYVERGHVGIANENQMQNYGRDYLTVPEGFDLGSDYLTAWTEASVNVAGGDGAGAGTNAASILVYSTADLFSSGGTVENPKLVSAKGSKFFGVVSGADITIFRDSISFAKFLNTIKETPWIGQSIISATMIPPIERYMTIGWTYPAEDPDMKYYRVPQFDYPANAIKGHTLYSNWRDKSDITDGWATRYRKLKKFFTYPYMVIEMTMYGGTPIMLKPELWRSPHANVVEIPQLNPPNQRVVFYPKNYNSNNDIYQVDNPIEMMDDDGEFMDMTTLISGFPTLAIVNNMAISYMASNANQLAWQFDSADWAQQRALGSAQATYDISSGAINAVNAQTSVNTSSNIASTVANNKNAANQALVNTIGNTAQGFVGSSVFGPGAAAAGAVSAGISGLAGQVGAAMQIDTNNQLTNIQNAAAVKSAGIQTGQQSLVRDTNYDLAKWAARGDYANQIAGVNAKIQDAKMIQPSVSGQVGGDPLLFTTWIGVKLRLRFKTIDNNVRAVIGDFWLRYGYAINRFMSMPQSLMVMTKFTYWKCTELYIRAANVPEGHKQAIRGIIEKGVTVYAKPDYIGTVDIADNEPLEGIRY